MEGLKKRKLNLNTSTYMIRRDDSQFNNTKIKNSKIQVQNKTQTLMKSYTFLSKAWTHGEHINIKKTNKQKNKKLEKK